MSKIAFLGLGVMGYPMAGYLQQGGHETIVWNRTAKKSGNWVSEYHGQRADDIETAVQDADFVMMCVGNDDDAYAVANPALAVMKEGSILIDHTTVSATCARKCAATAHKRHIGYIDAPVSGGEAGAQSGQLTIMCGGEKDVFARALPVMQLYAKAVKLMGPVGAGQLTKMVNQICIAGTLQGLSEALHFAQKAGLDVDEVVEAIGKGAAQSWQMDNRARTMGKGEFDFGFAVDWMRKDLKIALETAEDNGADLTMTRLVDGYYKDVQALGGNRWDTSSLIKRLDK
jgi:3-hydroxyisobutyrate dehydrogenase-like beta-hydroxyacid dehydrogenase